MPILSSKVHFDLISRTERQVEDLEKLRIDETISMVPQSWNSVVDVGAGDGRISNLLLSKGLSVIGLDWSAESLKHFKGLGIVADVAATWPVTTTFDGAICAEVLEHVPDEAIRKVLNNIRQHVSDSFIVSVPANEELESNKIKCRRCGSPFHIWGHLRSYKSFLDVDLMVGQSSTTRVFIPSGGKRSSRVISGLKRALGNTPTFHNAVCTECGEIMATSPSLGLIRLFCVRLLCKLESLSSFIRPETGWFLCLYEQSKK